MRKKLDIIIPTKNRYATLLPVVRSMLSCLNSEEYRIIIYDNTPEECKIILSDLPSDHRIIYHHDTENIDMVENWNRAIDFADSDFSILIGDDDLVLPGIFDAIRKLEVNDLDCLIQERPTFYWPNMKFNREFDFFSPASLQITKDIDGRVVELNPLKELRDVQYRGAIYLFNLPALYHGIVRTRVLKKMRQQYGSYALGPSPDISIAVLIAHSIKRYGIVGQPFSIAGASFSSAAGMGRRGEHSATLDSAPAWVPREMLMNWDPDIPKIWNGFTVYAQSLYLVGRRANIPIEINYNALYKKMLSENFRDIKFMSGENAPMRSPKISAIVIGLMSYILRSAIMHLPKFLLNFLVRRHPAFCFQAFYTNIKNPEDCIIKAESHISRFAIQHQ